VPADFAWIADARRVVGRRGRSRWVWARRGGPRRLGTIGSSLLVLGFLAYATLYLQIDLTRLGQLVPRLWRLVLEQYYPPRLGYLVKESYLKSVLETLQMSYLAALFGLALAIPLAWCASFNMSPSPRLLYPAARCIIVCCRSVHEMVWTILFVAILGFGILPGVVALTLSSVGFAGKLFAEEIEAIDEGPVVAVRATGANRMQILAYAVLPQVRVAWTGISIYTWDAAFRASTVVGFFGAGGMGWHLRRSVQQLEMHDVAAILLSILCVVMMAEAASAWARRRVASA